ncbi:MULTISPECIES: TetR/AcrR family transcriptional regulator [unclassified Leisingera]|uniref:TetR/AcrR family transcriptional regulator n=1 Tax=unclassified Leisingera TaxID=2614906 RepID=UPI0002F122D2|nr:MULTISPECIES: TetR/AcrR family transcriptional regulator [unclassified Leisingera]KIC22221.1 TetR family transcriptional regulator [Leisingera sp. ANG-S3]KIC32720.1 TetR family transcriptional regulator [Leisingera sp. ANG-S5]KIC53597.1 TetR family transcriptional regulator [Leisingera sp. ANG-S]KID07991.1 TetR family transcriptional regulator [Leisingera sp. ANG1]
MTRAPQKRRLETRARLQEVAATIVQEQGYSGLRVEDVVARAGVAKGTLFSHFKDKDGLLAVLIGDEVMRLLDGMEAGDPPQDADELTARLAPHLDYVGQDRVIFDLLLRYSGTTAAEPDEVVTASFIRQVTLLTRWLQVLQTAGQIRQDQPPELLAEGIQAFLNHVLGVWFCMEHDDETPPARALAPYLQAWLQPAP